MRDFLIFWIWQHQKRSNSARHLQFFKLDNVKNEAILRDIFKFWTWQHQKQINSARHPSNIESWVQRWRPRTNAFCDFSTPPVKSTAHATKNWCQVIRSAAPVTQNHLSKPTVPTDLMLQNATPLRKSAPWPPNISDEHVFCTAPATRNATLQILFKCPTPAIVFGNATKHSNPHVLLTFGKVHNPLRLPRERTSERPKVARTCGGLYISTSKCASRHNGVHFLNISTSKSGPSMVCFVHFDFEMWFAPQRRAIFHLSSGQLAPHRPRSRAYFSTLQSPKSLEKHGKTQRLENFLPFRASPSSFFWFFLFSHLLSSNYFSLLSDSPHLCFSSVHIIGSLTSKLPSKKLALVKPGQSSLVTAWGGRTGQNWTHEIQGKPWTLAKIGSLERWSSCLQIDMSPLKNRSWNEAAGFGEILRKRCQCLCIVQFHDQ